ncbi:MAG: hypothetical protein ABSG82_01370 [Sedimentisphaerales bacterium]|jgi:hypothetical protein
MKLLLSGTTDTQASFAGSGYRVRMNGSHTYIDAAADLGLSAGQARRVTIVIYMSGLNDGGHNITIKQCLTNSSGYGQYQHYFPFVTQTISSDFTAGVISFDTFVHHIGELNYLIVELIDDNGDHSVTVSAFVFSDGFDKDSRVDVGDIEGGDAGLLQKAAKMLLNKAVQDKLTGAIRYYDDDGETVILTHTPGENESSLTRTPS